MINGSKQHVFQNLILKQLLGRRENLDVAETLRDRSRSANSDVGRISGKRGKKERRLFSVHGMQRVARRLFSPADNTSGIPRQFKQIARSRLLLKIAAEDVVQTSSENRDSRRGKEGSRIHSRSYFAYLSTTQYPTP